MHVIIVAADIDKATYPVYITAVMHQKDMQCISTMIHACTIYHGKMRDATMHQYYLHQDRTYERTFHRVSKN